MVSKSDIIIRPADKRDAPALLQVHYDVIHKIAIRDYPPQIISEWASEIDKDRLERFISNPDEELRYAVEQIMSLRALELWSYLKTSFVRVT